MKITKTQLKQIIKEELAEVFDFDPEPDMIQEPDMEASGNRSELEADALALGIRQDTIDKFDDNEDLISLIDAVGEQLATTPDIERLDFGRDSEFINKAIKSYSSLR